MEVDACVRTCHLSISCFGVKSPLAPKFAWTFGRLADLRKVPKWIKQINRTAKRQSGNSGQSNAGNTKRQRFDER